MFYPEGGQVMAISLKDNDVNESGIKDSDSLVDSAGGKDNYGNKDK